MTTHHWLTIACDHEPECPARFTCREWLVGPARNLARTHGWSTLGRRDLCPEHGK